MGEFEFVVSDGSGRTHTRPFPGPRFVVGAGPDCQMRFDGGGLLPAHVEVILDSHGQPWVRDLTGRALVWVNGEATKQAMIPSGSLVRIGALELVVRHRSAASPLETRMAEGAPRRSEPPGVPGNDATVRRPTPFLSGHSAPMPEPQPVPSAPDDSTFRSTLLQPGTIIDDRYQVVGKLAAGGMGEVYRAQHVQLGKAMALKVMLPELSRDPEFVDRFKREAIAASRIGQQNIVDISDFGSTKDGRFYFVMEFLDGLTLASVVHRGGAMLVERVVAVTLQVARALAAAHALGIVHRDLKPENIMLLQRPGQQDFVKVLDFGVAKVAAGHGQGGQTRIGMVVGTPQYMSPEQAKAIPVDARSDVYSLGLIVYELITGRPTFTGETPSILMVKHVTEAPSPFEPGPLEAVPAELEELVFQMLEKDPGARPQAMEEVVHRLDSLEAKLRSGVPLRPRSAVLATPTGAGSGVAVRVSGGHRSVVSSGARIPSVVARASSGDGFEPIDEPSGDGELEVAPPRRSSGPLIGGLVALALLAGVGTFFLLREPTVVPVGVPEVQAQAQVEPVAVTPPPAPVPEKAPPAPPTRVKLRVVTSPAGAAVSDENDTWLGKTPFYLSGAPDSVVELRFALKGYLPQTRKVRLGSDQTYEVNLDREPTAKPRPAPRRPDLSGNPYESDPGSDLKPLPD